MTQPSKGNHDLMTLEEVLEVLRIGGTKGYQMARRDELPIPTLRIGREFRFSRRKLQAWIDGDGDTEPEAIA